MSIPTTNGMVIMPCEVAHEAPCPKCKGSTILRTGEACALGNVYEYCPTCLGGGTQSAAALVAQGHREDS